MYLTSMNEEPRSPEGFRDEVSYRKELLFPYSLANPVASCEECARYPIHKLAGRYCICRYTENSWMKQAKRHF
jgi:hypothetical protein